METASVSAPVLDDERPLLASVSSAFAAAVANGAPLFTTDASDLWGKFLFMLPEGIRQQYTCNACRRFVETYGGLVAVTADGHAIPAMWGDVPEPFAQAVAVVRRAVLTARITGPFLSTVRVWGLPRNHDGIRGCDWRHMSVTPPAAYVRKPSPLLNDDQAMAAKREEYAMLCRGLAEFPLDLVRNALTLLTTGQLNRSEKCEAVARWLLDLHEKRASTQDTRAKDNLTWLAVASAPAGWCHVRSGMIGTLLEDLSAGLDFPAIKRRFDEKMHPLQYMRPQVPPSAGNIAQAEKVMEALRTTGALERRFAKIEDCVLLWRPTPAEAEKPNGAGVFAHLKPKGSAAKGSPVEAPPTLMTWEKFARTVLPDALRIEIHTPSHGNYIAMVTAANPVAPPIVQWDREDRRNPVTHYVYNGGSPASRWNLTGNVWHPVTGICLFPPHWYGDGLASQGEGVTLLLAGARDVAYVRSGGFFPETLKGEYHAIRSTLEAYARQAVIAGKDDATACGYALSRGGTWNVTVRVTSKAGRVSYRLDRWD